MKDYPSNTLATAAAVGFVADGKLYAGAVAANILVQQESDLSVLDDMPPGTLAHTPGYANIWELDIEGNWVAIE